MHFKFPDALRWKSASAPLEVVLVNAKTRERPAKAEVLAQANLNRGGNVDENRRAKTPLPVTEPRAARARTWPTRSAGSAALEAQQQRAARAGARVAEPRAGRGAERQPQVEEPGAQPSGRDLADLALAAMRLQAQIDRQIEEYQKRPRKKFIGANAAEYRFAQYEEDWRVKVERIGTLNYPPEARGKLYGNLRLTVTHPPRRQRRVDRARPLLRPQGARRRGVQDRAHGDAVRRVSARHPARHRPAGDHAHLVLRPGRQDLD